MSFPMISVFVGIENNLNALALGIVSVTSASGD